jgi:hypothetical protein
MSKTSQTLQLMKTMNTHNPALMQSWRQSPKMMNTMSFVEEPLLTRQLMALLHSYPKPNHTIIWGPAFTNYSQLEFECIIQLQDKSSSAKESDNSRGCKPRPGFQLGSGHPLYASHVGVICMKMCTPMLAGAPPPKFPGNQPIKDESHISKWITDIMYYAEYLINLCVPWPDESLPSFKRSVKGFFSLVHAWSSKSASFIEHQGFCFLSNVMSKGHQSSHDKAAATAWCQRNTD